MKLKPHALLLSRIITVILFAFVAVCLALLPTIMQNYFDYRQMPQHIFKPLLILCYLAAFCVAAALILLMCLLSRIAKGMLFDIGNVRLLGSLSLCCALICIITAIGCIWYFPCIIISIAAGFLFLILQVLQNVFTVAVNIKDENDMTI